MASSGLQKVAQDVQLTIQPAIRVTTHADPSVAAKMYPKAGALRMSGTSTSWACHTPWISLLDQTQGDAVMPSHIWDMYLQCFNRSVPSLAFHCNKVGASDEVNGIPQNSGCNSSPRGLTSPLPA